MYGQTFVLSCQTQGSTSVGNQCKGKVNRYVRTLLNQDLHNRYEKFWSICRKLGLGVLKWLQQPCMWVSPVLEQSCEPALGPAHSWPCFIFVLLSAQAASILKSARFLRLHTGSWFQNNQMNIGLGKLVLTLHTATHRIFWAALGSFGNRPEPV